MALVQPKLNVLYLLNTFPTVSETFVKNEVLWMWRNKYLSCVIALEADNHLLQLLPSGLLSKIYIRSLRYGRRILRPLVASYWLTRSPIKFISVWRSVPRNRKSRKYFWYAAAIAIAVQRHKPDIIHSHFADVAAQYAQYLSRLINVPFTVCTHGHDIFFSPPANYPQLAQASAMIFAVSNYNRDFLVEKKMVAKEKVSVVHCGINVEEFNRIKPYPCVNDGPLQLVNVGRLVEVKGHEYLVEACNLLRKCNIDFRLTVIGFGELHQRLSEQIKTLQLEQYITLMGAQPPDIVRDQLERSHIFILSSLSEGISVAAMEAMGMGLPIISTNINGMPELVEHEYSGLLVQPKKPASIANAIYRLAANREYAFYLGCNGRKKVFDQFNASVEYSKLVDIWKMSLTQVHDAPRRKTGSC